MRNKLRYYIQFLFSADQINLIQIADTKSHTLWQSSADPYQLEAKRPGSEIFAKAEHTYPGSAASALITNKT